MTYPFDHKAQAARDAARQAFLDRRTCVATDEQHIEAQPGENQADAIKRRIKDLRHQLKEMGEEEETTDEGGPDIELDPFEKARTEEAEKRDTKKAQASRDSTYEAFMKRRHSQVPTMDYGRVEGARLDMAKAQRIGAFGHPMEWKS